MSLDSMPPHPHTKHWNKSSQQRLVIALVGTGEDLLGVPGGHGYSRSATEPQPAGDRCGRVRRNVDTAESRRNGPQLSMRYDDDDDDETACCRRTETVYIVDNRASVKIALPDSLCPIMAKKRVFRALHLAGWTKIPFFCLINRPLQKYLFFIFGRCLQPETFRNCPKNGFGPTRGRGGWLQIFKSPQPLARTPTFLPRDAL